MSSTGGNYGISVLSVLGIVFVVLKLIGTITWSWWWVLMPFIVEFGLLILVLAIVGIVLLIAASRGKV
jgi:hypothetical protein